MDSKDRITWRMSDGTSYVQSETGTEGVGYYTTQRRIPEMIARLCAYEDTGLSPDEIVAIKAKLGEFSEAFKGARAVCEVVISEKKQAIAERDRFKARAEAAEADMKRIADDMDGETDACYPCALCVKNNSKCDVGDTCFEWRGPQEGAAE